MYVNYYCNSKLYNTKFKVLFNRVKIDDDDACQ